MKEVLQVCIIEHAETIVRLTSQVVNKKEILNEELVYELAQYTVGSIKCFTQKEADVQREANR